MFMFLGLVGASCGSGGQVVAVLSGSGDATEVFRLATPSNLSYSYSVTNDGPVACIALEGIRMHPLGHGGQGPTVQPSATVAETGGLHLAAGDWLIDFQMHTTDNRETNLMSCHWHMELTTSDQAFPDVPKTGCLRPELATFPAGPVCTGGEDSRVQVIATP